jgi:hypothetical protein
VRHTFIIEGAVCHPDRAKRVEGPPAERRESHSYLLGTPASQGMTPRSAEGASPDTVIINPHLIGGGASRQRNATLDHDRQACAIAQGQNARDQTPIRGKTPIEGAQGIRWLIVLAGGDAAFP